MSSCLVDNVTVNATAQFLITCCRYFVIAKHTSNIQGVSVRGGKYKVTRKHACFTQIEQWDIFGIMETIILNHCSEGRSC